MHDTKKRSVRNHAHLVHIRGAGKKQNKARAAKRVGKILHTGPTWRIRPHCYLRVTERVIHFLTSIFLFNFLQVIHHIESASPFSCYRSPNRLHVTVFFISFLFC